MSDSPSVGSLKGSSDVVGVALLSLGPESSPLVPARLKGGHAIGGSYAASAQLGSVGTRPVPSIPYGAGWGTDLPGSWTAGRICWAAVKGPEIPGRHEPNTGSMWGPMPGIGTEPVRWRIFI